MPQLSERWYMSWTAIPCGRDALARLIPIPESFSGRTLRQIVRATVGGSRIRVRLSNEYGTEPLRIAAASVAIAHQHAAIAESSVRALKFDGSSAFQLAPGDAAASDPVDLPVEDFTALAVSMYLPHSSQCETIHAYDESPAHLSAPGDFAMAPEMPIESTFTSLFFLSGIEVAAPPTVRAVVALGDSITNGLDESWPSLLARRLAQRQGSAVALANAGIPGNRLLDGGMGESILERLDRDALQVPGVTHVILLAGINDLGYVGFTTNLGPTVAHRSSVSAAQLIAGYERVIARASAAGVKLIGGTLMPFAGAETSVNKGYFSPGKDAQRKAVNAWIRTPGRFDGVIDFEKIVADPADPDRIRQELHIGDFLHPSAAGNRLIADSIDLALFDAP